MESTTNAPATDATIDPSRFRRSLFRSLVLPSALLALVATVLFWEMGTLLGGIGSIDRSSAIITRANRVRELLVSTEFALKSYLDTGDHEFLDRHAEAVVALESSLDELERTLSAEPLPATDSALRNLRSSYPLWIVAASRLLTGPADATEAYTTRMRSNQLMSEMRSAAAAILESQLALQAGKIESRRESAGLALAVTAVSTLVIGFLLAIFARRQLTTLSDNYARALEAAERNAAERTELHLREQAARAEAENANRAKDEFLAILSHELRTPLNAIVLGARLLRTPGIDRERRERALDIITRNAALQVRLNEDLLDVSRIIAGKLVLDLQPMDAAALVREIADNAREAAADKDIELGLTIACDPAPIRGDTTRLVQAIGNVVANAIKFTPRGGHVRLRLERAAGRFEIRVEDDGVGIRPDVLPGIFERFRQAGEGTSRRQGGLGLGLAIARSILSAHGGSIDAESAGENRGATFHVSLPPDPSPPALRDVGRRAGDAASGFPRLDGTRVLLVDDEPEVVELLGEALGRYGAEVLGATSVREALEKLDAASFDIVLSDVSMPEVDGFDLLQAIRDRETGSGRRVPVVAITALASEDERRALLEAGFDLHVPKPIDPSELVSLIAVALADPGSGARASSNG